MRELLNKFFIWLREPDPDTILIKLWREKRDRDKVIERIEAKRQAEEYRQKVKEQAYLLWEADGKQEGKDEYYWKLAVDKVKGNNISCIYQIYYWVEKHILEPSDAWIKRQASISILSQLAILATIIAFIGSENAKRNDEVFAAWTTITTSEGQSGSGGRIEALEFLNSRPLKFPWIGWTEEDWFWDEGNEECRFKRLLGLRWERQPLVALSAPEGAYLRKIHLCGALLDRANLQDADLTEANLQGANLYLANLQDANLFEANLQGALLHRVNLQGAYLVGAKFKKADLEKASLQHVFLFGVNLQGANLYLANLQGASLSGVNLQGALLHRVNLQDADLQKANLQDAFLVEAYLQGANLNGANLQGAFLGNPWRVIELNFKQIKLACNWDKAVYKFEWNEEEQTFVALEPHNTNYIEELRNDTISDPQYPIDCSW